MWSLALVRATPSMLGLRYVQFCTTTVKLQTSRYVFDRRPLRNIFQCQPRYFRVEFEDAAILNERKIS